MIYTVTLNPAVDKTLIVPRFSVGAVNRTAKIIQDPGGKGINVSKSVQALGGESVCLGIVGGDSGRFLLSALDRLQLPHAMVLSEHATRTNTKIADPVLGTNTDINEPGETVTEALLLQVWQMLQEKVKPGDTVVLAGKNPPGTPEDLLAQWTKALKASGVKVCLDTVGAPMKLAVAEQPFLIKPNAEELEELLERKLESPAQIAEGARELVDRGVTLVAVSMGAEGAIFASEDGVVRSFAPKVEAVSTVGAGDSMMAGLIYYLQKNCTLEELAGKATAVATATVTVEGSKPASKDAVERMEKQVRIEVY